MPKKTRKDLSPSDISFSSSDPTAGPPPPYDYAPPPPPPHIVIVQQQALINPPADGILFAVFVAMCCFMPIGLFAVIRSVQCRSAIEMGNQEMAEKRSKETRQLSIAGVLVGVLIYIVYIVLHIYVIKPESRKN